MRKLTGAAFVSIDGVMQAPGGPGEDPTGGFAHGGWMAPMDDELVDETIGDLFTPPYDLLLGRRTYDIFAAYWPYVTGPERGFAKALNSATKHVITHSDAPLAWENSHRLNDIDAVAELKRSDGPDLLVQGSSTLYPQLLGAGLLDRLVLMIFPVVLGDGKRLFDGGDAATSLEVVDQKLSGSGVLVAHYAPGGAVATGAMGEPSSSDREQKRQAAMSEGRW